MDFEEKKVDEDDISSDDREYIDKLTNEKKETIFEKDTNYVKDTIATIFDGVSVLADTKKVIGEPYIIGDTTIIPFIETSMGTGIGSFSDVKQAGGVGCKITPIACLVIQNGFTKLISIKNQDSITKALDMIPDFVDKILKKQIVPEEVEEKIQDLSNAN